MNNLRNISILGSTGSIGTQTLETIKLHGGFNIRSLAVAENIELLEKQIREFSPAKVCVYNEAKAEILKKNLSGLSTQVLSGMEGLIELASDAETDLVVTAVVGMIGIRPTIAAISAGKDVALANKETLVTAGHIIIPLVKEKGVRLLPIDSEHSAIFQCLQGKFGPDGYYSHGNGTNGVSRLLLTASGGPFRGKNYEELEKMTPSDALKHPNWSMGKKITIDSASMVNKALEVMEAKWLFGVEPDNICIVIQPKSIIHSAVEFCDGSIIAQLGCPDMRLPIQYALYYPERLEAPGKRLDLFEVADIHCEKPDYEVFKGLRLGLEAIKQGGSVCTVFNAANEFAVARFLEERIGFTGIYDMIEAAMKHHINIQNPSLEQILEAEKETYDYLEGFLR